MTSNNVKIVEYGPHNNPLGYIEPVGDSPAWIMWWYQDGHAELYTERAKSGATIGSPILLPAPMNGVNPSNAST
jgi:hypothetical protein